jgi:gluconokinase
LGVRRGNTNLVVMGVSGVGKTTIGCAVAQVLGWQYVEGDDFHSAANRHKMTAGVALTDDRLRRSDIPLRFVWLSGSESLISERLRERQDHYMPSSLLRSQLDALEPPLPEEQVLNIDVAQPASDLAVLIAKRLNLGLARAAKL